MARFEPLGHGVYCVDALYMAPGVASIYLVHADDEVAIIETGTRYSVDNVCATLEALQLDPSQVRYVIPTHVHLDHAGGAAEMMRRFAQARLIVHPRGARHLIDPSRLVAGSIAVYGEEPFRKMYGDIEPIDEARVDIAEDESRFNLGQRELLFIDTPGHARHHFCVIDAASAGVFTGDTFGISYTRMKTMPRGLLPTTPPTQFDPPALRESIGRIMSYAPERLYLTHYGAYEGPAATLASFRDWIDVYENLALAHAADEEALEQSLETELRQRVLDALGPDDHEIESLIRHDLRLNAQGLAHWRRAQHG